MTSWWRQRVTKKLKTVKSFRHGSASVEALESNSGRSDIFVRNAAQRTHAWWGYVARAAVVDFLHFFR